MLGPTMLRPFAWAFRSSGLIQFRKGFWVGFLGLILPVGPVTGGRELKREGHLYWRIKGPCNQGGGLRPGFYFSNQVG